MKCPECAQGKTVNCATIALDPSADDFVPCETAAPVATDRRPWPTAARSRLMVEIRLDPVPGWGNTAEDHRVLVQRLLEDAVGHYQPTVTLMPDIDALAKLLAEHEGCVPNAGQDNYGSGLTGVDVWSCGIRVPYVDDLDIMARLHLATALAGGAS